MLRPHPALRIERRKSPQREERHIRHALRRELIHKGVIVSPFDVEKVRYADDLRNLLRLSQLPRRDIAQTEMTDQPLLEFGQHGQRFFNRSL